MLLNRYYEEAHKGQLATSWGDNAMAIWIDCLVPTL